MDPFVVAIDGPAGAGKGTIAKFLAEKLNFLYIDSGLFYRYFSYQCKEAPTPYQGKENPTQTYIEEKIQQVAHQDFFAPILQYLKNPNQLTDIIREIKQEKIGARASKMSCYPPLRTFITSAIRSLSSHENLVIDGRDTGTVIFPQATLKIFITASVRSRAERRKIEMDSYATPASESISKRSLQQYIEDMNERDHLDLTRTIAPLIQAPDAVVLDSSNLTIEEAKASALALVAQVLRVSR